MSRKRRSLLDYAPTHEQAANDVRPSPMSARSTARNPQKRAKKQTIGGFLAKFAPNDEGASSGFRGEHEPSNSALNYAGATQSPRQEAPPKSFHIDPDKPLLDFVSIAMSVWQRKFLIILLGFIGLVLGVFVALSIPHKYYAESQIFLDPRELRLTEVDVGNNQISTELLLALVDTQMRVATSTSVLEKAIDELGLEEDPEFNGQASAGLGEKIRSLLSSNNASLDRRKTVLDQLRESVGVGRDPKTLVVSLGATTRNADKSALIANTLVDKFLEEYSLQKSGFFNQTSSSIQSRLEELKERLDQAEKAKVKYRAENDIIDVGGGVINQKEMLALSDELTKIRADQVAKSVVAQELSKVDISSVISGAFPQAALTATLTELQKQYATAKSTADSLAVGLGPRHPKLVSAQAAVKALEGDIRDELRRIVAAAQREAARAKQSENKLASQLAVLKSRSSDQSVENIELEELNRKAESLRALYEQLLKSSSETAIQGELDSSKIQIISRAEPPDNPSSMSRKIIVIVFAFLGGLVGLAYAIIMGAWAGLKKNFVEAPISEPKHSYGAHQQTPDQSQSQVQQANQTVSNASDEQHPVCHSNHQPMANPEPTPGMAADVSAAPAYYDPRFVHPSAYATQPIYAPVQPYFANDQMAAPNLDPAYNQAGSQPENAKANNQKTGTSDYVRLNNDVQKIRNRLEDWARQKNR